ncbi:MAG: hypothetical protein JO122_09955 [Acetobacteraceae bacterium]|nr:hypothetical protein [Acetobacteraceae bacterium]
MRTRSPALIATSAIAGMVFGAVMFNAEQAKAILGMGDIVSDPGLYPLITGLQDAAVQAIQNMATSVVNKVTDIGNLFDVDLQTATNEITNYIKGQTAAQQQIADASNQAMAQYQGQVRAVQATLDHMVSPTSCVALDGAQAAAAAEVRRGQIVQILASVTDPRGEGLNGTPAYYGGAQAAAANQQLHLARYCSDLDTEAGLPCSGSPLPDGDQRAVSLLGQGTYQDQQHIDAAHDYLMSLFQPNPPPPLRGAARASTAGMQQEQLRKGYNAAISASYGVGDWILASRAASVTLTADQQAEMRAEGLTPTATASWHDAMDLEAMRRYGGLAGATGLERMDTAPPLLREIARVQAFAAYIEWQRYKLEEHVALVQAAALARAANDAFTPTARVPTMPIPTVVGSGGKS